MASICATTSTATRLPLPYPFAMMAPDLGLPRTPNARNIPPMPRPDVLIPDEEDEEKIDLPVEDEPDTGVLDEEEPEEQPDIPPSEEIKHRRNDTGDALPPRPEKQRKPDLDEPVPQPETHRKRAPTLQ